jgi:shikimate dehydrogenase
VYDPVETALLAEARRRGFCTIDGLEMLMEQAAMSFAAFFDAAPISGCAMSSGSS